MVFVTIMTHAYPVFFIICKEIEVINVYKKANVYHTFPYVLITIIIQIVDGDFQEDTLTSFLFIICQNHVLQM